jgi:hypothetical protein
MSKISLNTPLPDEAASNRFLCALWANLRAEFGKLAWQYQPIKYGSEKTIYFGYADLGLSSSIRIGVTYRRRGVIDHIVFLDVFGEINLPVAQFERCVRLAENAIETEITISAKIVVPYNLCFQRVEGQEFFSILNDEYGTTYLSLRLCVFDEADAAHKFALYSKQVLDVLSSFKNLFLSLESTDQKLSHTTSNQVVSSFSLDWLDGFPVNDHMVILPDQCLAFIDDIVRNNLDSHKQKLLDACHHFHSARAMEEQILNFSFEQSVQSELSLVLYLSCLEVLSLIGAPPSISCSTCGQPQYRISARVTDFMEKHNGLSAAQIVKDLYNYRSKYLREGRLLSTRSYTGQLIPQLDSSSTNKNGVRSPLPLVPLLNLREFTSFCIRSVVYELTSAE